MIFTATHGTWGERVRTFSWDGGISTILFLEPNRRCSWHSHTAAWNRFFVISGCLGVKTDKNYTTKLGPKQMFEVEPGVMHEFQTYDEPTVIEEIAYVRYDEKDIDREELGGVNYSSVVVCQCLRCNVKFNKSINRCPTCGELTRGFEADG